MQKKEGIDGLYSDVMKTIQFAHPSHHHNGFVTTYQLWPASGGVHALLVLEPTECSTSTRLRAIVVMRRMGALDCLHDVTIYVLCSLLCAC